MWAVFPSSDYYTPTAVPSVTCLGRGHWSFLIGSPAEYFRSPSHPFGNFPCSSCRTSPRRCRWQLPVTPCRELRFPESREGTSRFASVALLYAGRLAYHGSDVAVAYRIIRLSPEVRWDRAFLYRKVKSASGGFTMASLSQAHPLGYLPSPQCAFQGHAAHTIERSKMLSPNGSWGP